MKGIQITRSPENKRKIKDNIAMIYKGLKEYSKDNNYNLARYQQRKEVNNQFLSSYKQLISPPKKVMYQSPSQSSIKRDDQFNDLTDKYSQSNFKIPKDYLKRNIFEKSPWLMSNKSEISDYYYNESISKGDVPINDKVINAFTHMNDYTIKMIRKHELKALEHDTRRGSREDSEAKGHYLNNDSIIENRCYKKRLNKDIQNEIKQNQIDIQAIKQLILLNENDNGSVIIGSDRSLDLKGKLKPIEGINKENSTRNQLQLNQNILQSKRLNEEDIESTLSSTHLPRMSQKNTNSTSIRLSQSLSQSHQSLFTVTQKSQIPKAEVKRSITNKHNTSFISKPLLVNATNTNSSLDNLNDFLPIASHQTNPRRRQINLLYPKGKQDHNRSSDILNNLYSQLNDSSSERKFNSNAMIHSLNKMQHNINRTNIPIMFKKFNPLLPEKTQRKIHQVSNLDKTLSSLGTNIIQSLIKARIARESYEFLDS